jgi:hypothetical protein
VPAACLLPACCCCCLPGSLLACSLPACLPAACLPAACHLHGCCLLLPACLLPAYCLPAVCLLPACCLPVACLLPACRLVGSLRVTKDSRKILVGFRLAQTTPKMIPKWLQDATKKAPKWLQNCFKINQNCSWNPPGGLLAIGCPFWGLILPSSWPLGALLDPSRAKKNTLDRPLARLGRNSRQVLANIKCS